MIPCKALTKHLLPCLLATATLLNAQSWTAIGAEDPALQYLGRTWPVKTKGGQDARMLAWSGTSVSLRFEGSAVKALLSSPSTGTDSSWYKVFVDGVFTQDIPFADHQQSGEILLAEGLAEGTHTVRLYKRTEAMMGQQAFAGFSVFGTPSSQALADPERRLEFIGNSITCGYGILDSCAVNPKTWDIDESCPGFTTRGQDHYLSYAAVAARELDAAAQTVCWSGKGVLRNAYPYGDGPTMPTEWAFAQPIFHFTDTAHAARWDHKRYIPHAVVINLGTNDFSHPTVPPKDEFVSTYVNFIQAVRSAYGDTIQILLLHGPMMSDGYPVGLKAATTLSQYLDSTIQRVGGNVHKLMLTPTQSLQYGVGGDWHPNAAQHRLNATQVSKKLSSMLGWSTTPIGERPRGQALRNPTWHTQLPLSNYDLLGRLHSTAVP